MSSSLFSINTAQAQTRQGGETLNSIIPVQELGNARGSGELSGVMNQLFYLGLAAAAVLAVAMIVRGGIQYMATDSQDSKGRAKRRIQAAVGGLVLAFASVLLLQTINPSLTKLNLTFEDIKVRRSGGVGLEDAPNNGPTSVPRPTTPTQPSGNWTENGADQWATGLANGTRSTDGRLVISAYGSQGDDVTDSNTAAGRGSADNLLREGSVALSPDLVRKYGNPPIGSEVFVNGVSVGFYEDVTAGQYKGTTFNNTIDIYDTNGSLGGIQNFGIRNIPPGQWNITFGAPRTQIPNPS